MRMVRRLKDARTTSGKISVVIGLTVILTFPVSVVSGAKSSPKLLVTSPDAYHLTSDGAGDKHDATHARMCGKDETCLRHNR
jgi:hypothetical protein